jgi:hypothetical protein
MTSTIHREHWRRFGHQGAYTDYAATTAEQLLEGHFSAYVDNNFQTGFVQPNGHPECLHR